MSLVIQLMIREKTQNTKRIYMFYMSVFPVIFAASKWPKKPHSHAFKCLTGAVADLQLNAVRAKIGQGEMFLLKTSERVHVHE